MENTAVLWMKDKQYVVTTAAFCSKYASPVEVKKIFFAIILTTAFIHSIVAH